MPFSLSDQGTDVKTIATGTAMAIGNLSIEVWSANESGTLIWNRTYFNGIANGTWNVMIGETTALNLEYGKKYWKDYAINDEDVNFTNAAGNSVDRQFWYSPLGEINTTYINESSLTFVNLTISGNMTIQGSTLTVGGISVCLENGTNCLGGALGISPFTNDSEQIYVRSGYPSYINLSSLLYVNGSEQKVGFGNAYPETGLHVGLGSPNRITSGNINDTFITGRFEVDGASYFDGAATFYSASTHRDNVELYLGTSNDAVLKWSLAQATENTALFGLGTTANSLIFTNIVNQAKDYDHPAQSNPTTFWQSAEDPDADNTRWGSIAHDNESFVIDSGYGNITLDDTTTVSGDLELADNNLGRVLLDVYDNGTRLVFNSVNPVDFTQIINVPQLTINGTAVSTSASANLTGSGTATYVPLWTSTGVLGDSDALDTSEVMDIMDSSGNVLLRVNKTAERTEFWDAAGGANDYVRISHDSTDGFIESASGGLKMRAGGVNLVWDGTQLTGGSNTKSLGVSTAEWKNLYLGENTSSGAYFGVSQDAQIWYNQTNRTLFIESSAANVSVVAPEFRVYDDARGADDYVGISHDSTDAIINAQSGLLRFRTAGANRVFINDLGLHPNAANDKTLGSATVEWMNLYLGEDKTSGLYFGLDQDWRLYYNETSEDALILRNRTGHNVTTWKGGNVGIGTTDPTAKLSVSELLQVNGDASPQYPTAGAGLEMGYDSDDTTGDTTGRGFIQVYDRDTPGYKDLMLNSYSMQFRAGEKTRMYLENTGDLGIGGQTAPGMALHVGQGSSSQGLTNSENDTYITGDLEVDGTAYLDQNVIVAGNLTVLGDYINATVTNQYLNGTFIPGLDDKFDIGTSSLQWRDAYFSGNITAANLNVTGTTYLGNVVIDSENISVTNILPRNVEKGVTVRNGSGGKLGFFNTTAGKLEVWSPLEGATDYLQLYHTGTTGYVSAGGTALNLGTGLSSQLTLTSSAFYPTGANTITLGANTLEYKGLFLGEDVGSGTYYGLDQDWRLYYNETSEDALIFANRTGSEILVLDGGRVGIGTPNPTQTLHVATAGTGGGLLLERNDGAASNFSITNAGSILTFDYVGATGGYKFDIEGDTKMVIEESGDIGLGGQLNPGMALHVGNGTSSHSLTNSANDTYITGKFEVDGETWFDNAVYHAGLLRMNDDAVLVLGTSADTAIDWSTAQATENTVVFGLGDASNSIIFTDKTNTGKDFDHSAQSNPTIFMQSAEDPDADNTRWGSISHDNSSFVIDSGYGNITLDDTTFVSGDVQLGDQVIGQELAVMEDNGSRFLITTVNPVEFTSNVNLPQLLINGTPVSTAAGANLTGTGTATYVPLWTSDGVLGDSDVIDTSDATDIMDSSGNVLLRVNKTAERTEFWDAAGGANDYVSIYHDGSNAKVATASGGLYFRVGSTDVAFADSSTLSPGTANLRDLGSTNPEWRALYLGNDSVSGTYYGMGQEARIWMNNTNGTLFIETFNGKNVSVIAPSFKIWNDAKGQGDYLELLSTTTATTINSNPGTLVVQTQGADRAKFTGSYLGSVGAGVYDLGHTSTEWQGLYLHEDVGSGTYFGADQDWRLYYNESTEDALILQNRTNATVMAFQGGRVGIGTNSPEAELHINGTGDPELRLESATDTIHLGMKSSSNSWDIAAYGAGSAYTTSWGIEDGSDIRFLIDSAGDIGLGGQTAPGMALHVGQGSSSHSLTNSENDTYITGDLEVDGVVYFDSNLTVAGNLNVTGTSYLGNIVLDSENISVTNILARNVEKGVTVRNGSGGKLGFFNTTAGRLEVWNPLEGANDYVSIYHDGTNAVFDAASGSAFLRTAGASIGWDGTNFYRVSANHANLGTTTYEFKSLYLGEDVGSGAYFGLDQDWRLYYNETNLDSLVMQNSTGGTVMSWNSSKVGIGVDTPLNPLHVEGVAPLRLSRSGVESYYYSITSDGISDVLTLTSSDTGDEIARFGSDQRIISLGKTGLGGQINPGMALHVGTGSSDHTLTDQENDTYITGKLEVDEASYFDGAAIFGAYSRHNDNVELDFGTSVDSAIDWSTAQATENTLVWGLGSTANSIIFTDYSYVAQDFDHPAQSQPTIFIQSNEDPDNDNTRWGSIAHDNDSFVIDSGSDKIVLDDSTYVSGNISLADAQVGVKLADMYDNSTHFIIDTVNPVKFTNNIDTTQLLINGTPVSTAAGANLTGTGTATYVPLWTSDGVLGDSDVIDTSDATDIMDSSGNVLLRVNKTSYRTEFWDEAGGANDYVSVYHEGSNGYINTQSGSLYNSIAGTVQTIVTTTGLLPSGSDTKELGRSDYEWKRLYLSENASSGAYFGVAQDAQIWYNNTNRTLFIESPKANVSVVTPEFRVWDDARGDGDYAVIRHDGTNAYFGGQTGSTYLTSAGTNRMFITSGGLFSTSVNDKDLGSPTYEWAELYLGEDVSSGAYFGLDQNWRLYYNETNLDALIMQNRTGATVMSWENSSVGIGTTSPNAKLDISAGTIASLGKGMILEADIDTNPSVYTSTLQLKDGSTGLTSITFGGDSLGIIRGESDGTSSSGRLTFYTRTGASTPDEKMRLDSSGNLTVDSGTLFVDAINDRVGVGTKIPSYTLDVNGTANALQMTINGTPIMVNGSDYCSGGTCDGSLTVTGNFTVLGNYINATVENQYLNGTFSPGLSNTFDIGTTSKEWRGIYAGEDASSGTYYGLDQDARIWYNNTNRTLFIETSGENISVIAPDLKVWDDAKGEGDYVRIRHDGANSQIYSASGTLALTSAVGNINTQTVLPDGVATRNLGSTGAEWKTLYLAEDAGSGTYYGLDQDAQMWYNNTNRTLFIETSGANVSVVAPRFRVYDDARAEKDYVEIYHDGTHGRVKTASGTLFLGNSASAQAIGVTGTTLVPAGINTYSLGGTSAEWKNFYLGEDASSGAYFGLDQDARIYYNETSRDELVIEAKSDNISIVTDKLFVWDEDEAANDYVSISHDGTDGNINSQSGSLLIKLADTNEFIVADNSFYPAAANTHTAGLTSREWKNLYLGEDSGSGVIFGLDQDSKMYYNTTTGSTVIESTSDEIEMITTTLRVWDDAKGANDYVDVYHSGTDAVIDAASGSLALQSNSANAVWDGTEFYSGTNTKDLGHVNQEWRRLYLGNDTVSGAYFGLGQEARIWMNNTNRTLFIETSAANVSVVAPEFRVYDDARVANDYVSMYHDGSTGYIRTGSGGLGLYPTSGLTTTFSINPDAGNSRSLGGTANEWKTLYLGEDVGSGAYFGLNQDWRIYYNETAEDSLIFVSGGEDRLTMDTAMSDSQEIARWYGDGAGYARMSVDTVSGEDAQVSFMEAGSSKWSIGNDGTDDSFHINNGAGAFGSDEFVILSTGYVGIGTAAPSHELNVIGEVNITGNTIIEQNLTLGASSTVDGSVYWNGTTFIINTTNFAITALRGGSDGDYVCVGTDGRLSRSDGACS